MESPGTLGKPASDDEEPDDRSGHREDLGLMCTRDNDWEDDLAASTDPNEKPAHFVIAAVLGVAVASVALSLPNVTGDPNAMCMTHYMGVLMSNQPWNVLLFMGVPVVLAEIIAVSELRILVERGDPPVWVGQANRWAGLCIGPWFFGIFCYLLKNAVIPLTQFGIWHGPADVIAVSTYLSSAFPLVGIALIELNILGRASRRAKQRLHAIFVGIFLVVVHIAMIFGMFDPQQWGWTPPDAHMCKTMGM